MKKLKLSEMNLSNAEMLSREQMKKIVGGIGSGSDSVTCTVTCPDDHCSCSSTIGKCKRNEDVYGDVISITCEDLTYNCD